MREGWSELGDWSREEMEAAEEETRRGDCSDAYGRQISQLGEFFCDYSMLRKGHAPSANHPWIGRSRDLSWMRKGPIRGDAEGGAVGGGGGEGGRAGGGEGGAGGGGKGGGGGRAAVPRAGTPTEGFVLAGRGAHCAPRG